MQTQPLQRCWLQHQAHLQKTRKYGLIVSTQISTQPSSRRWITSWQCKPGVPELPPPPPPYHHKATVLTTDGSNCPYTDMKLQKNSTGSSSENYIGIGNPQRFLKHPWVKLQIKTTVRGPMFCLHPTTIPRDLHSRISSWCKNTSKPPLLPFQSRIFELVLHGL